MKSHPNNNSHHPSQHHEGNLMLQQDTERKKETLLHILIIKISFFPSPLKFEWNEYILCFFVPYFFFLPRPYFDVKTSNSDQYFMLFDSLFLLFWNVCHAPKKLWQEKAQITLKQFFSIHDV